MPIACPIRALCTLITFSVLCGGTSWAVVTCPEAIAKVGSSKKLSPLRVNFDGPEYPDAVVVRGTGDSSGMHGSASNPFWQSQDKYLSLNQIFDLRSGDELVASCSYNATGFLMEPLASFMIFNNPLYLSSGDSVFLWLSLTSGPVELSYFVFEPSATPAGHFLPSRL